jgi:hypothetical protein
MKETITSKIYVIEQFKIDRKTKIKMLDESEDSHIIINPDKIDDMNKLSMSEEEFNTLISPLLQEINVLGYLNGSTTPLEVEKDVISFIRQKYIRDFNLPSVEEIKNYIINRNQGFAK